jgi:hypothetical protein
VVAIWCEFMLTMFSMGTRGDPARVTALLRKAEEQAAEPVVTQILNILNSEPLEEKELEEVYGDRRTGLDYNTLFEYSEELYQLMDSWLAAGCRFDQWPLRQRLEKDLNTRTISFFPPDRDGRVSYEFTRPARLTAQTVDLIHGGSYAFDPEPGWDLAVSLFFQFITGPFFRDIGRCKRCRKFFWNRSGHRDKTYCGARCASADTAERVTRERRQKEHEHKLRMVQSAIRRFERLSAEKQARYARTWKSWVKNIPDRRLPSTSSRVRSIRVKSCRRRLRDLTHPHAVRRCIRDLPCFVDDVESEGIIDMKAETRYFLHMPVVQQDIMRTLQEAREPLTMSDLIQRVRDVSPQPTISIRAAVLPLITLRRVEFTPERKLRLKGV